LIKSKVFSLPGNKKLTHSDRQIEVVVVDVTETPIERLKKTKALLEWQEEKTLLSTKPKFIKYKFSTKKAINF
jgi:hypothetical protein